jgi:hypothetical protein
VLDGVGFGVLDQIDGLGVGTTTAGRKQASDQDQRNQNKAVGLTPADGP